ncbi:MAG: M23 family metallopeptidase [Rikenellaceae bacterium]
MNKTITILFLLFLPLALGAQSISPSYYIYPIEDVARLYSANFGELRSDHFHSGIDIKSDGAIGKKIVAVADGYISRIGLSPYGYGLSLYVTHPNGTTSVYAHLSRFSEPVTKYLEAERYRTKSHTANLYCQPDQFVVKQGEVIAYSGNSGSSAGPHLHFEIRNRDQEPINVVTAGVISPRDDIAPLIRKIHYIEVDTLQGVAREAERRSYDVAKKGSTYSIVGGGSILVGRNGYLVLEATDRRNDVTNTFGIYRAKLSVDSTPIFEYVMDGFSFGNTRYCNAIGYYPLMISSRNEVLRLAAVENVDRSHYRTLVGDGVLTSKAGEERMVEIEVEDDMGNLSLFNLSVVGRSDESCFVAEEVDPKLVINAMKQYDYRGENITVSIPAKSLYESRIFTLEESEPTDSTMLSRVYEVLDVQTPLHSAMMLSIATEVPFELQSKVGMVCVGRSGNPAFIGGDYLYGSVTAKSRNAGKFYVVADTEPPKLKLGIEDGSQQGSSKYFTCSVSDNLSGVARYSAKLDGEWIALDLDKGRLRHNFRHAPTGEEHTLVVEAVDGVGNAASVSCRFVR